jgi:hypothetical protein
MLSSSYYREKARIARRLASTATGELQELLSLVGRDYDDLAVDLEDGAIALIHPELMPQRRRQV